MQLESLSQNNRFVFNQPRFKQFTHLQIKKIIFKTLFESHDKNNVVGISKKHAALFQECFKGKDGQHRLDGWY